MSDLRSLYPCGRIERRRFLFQSAAGFMGSALSSLWAEDGKLMQDARLPGTPKAKSVIFLFMCGGVSHIDTFDPKDNKHAGKIMDAIGFGDNNAPDEAARDSDSADLQAVRQIGHSGLGLVSERGRNDRRYRRGSLDVLPSDEPLSRPCWKGQPESRCGSSSIPAWGVGCPMRWAPRIRICRPS